MTWLGLIGGIVLGGLIWELEGAIVLGFLGWLTGLIIKSNREAKRPIDVGAAKVSPVATGASQAGDLEARVARLEATVARLEARLGAGAAEAASVQATETQAASLETPEIPPPLPPAAAEEPPPIPEPAAAIEQAPPIPEEPAAPEPPAPPSKPNPIVAWLTGGNTIARVGLLILFIGFAFLLKYAADHRLLPPELRIMAVAIGGIALLGVGWRLRKRNPGYALGMQGAGIAVLYLTTFGALRLYHLLPPGMAFVLLAGIAVFSAMLAVMQDSVALAVIAAGGGFLAPILASSGGGNHVMLFSYYMVLNLGIAAIAWYKVWRALNLTGFLFTFAIGLLWGVERYRPEHFGTTEPFLVAFWLMYVAIAVLVARERPQAAEPTPARRRTASIVDGTLVFGVPIAGFALQAGLVRDMEYGLAITSLLAAGAYLAFAMSLLRTKGEQVRLLAQSFLALGVVFVTLAIPLALDARWTSASWALEGAAILWIGLRQKRPIARWFGLLLQFLGGLAYIEGYRRLPGGYPLVDAAFVGAVILALAGLWTHRLLLNHRESLGKGEAGFVVPAFMWGLFWTLFAGVDEIRAHVPAASFVAGVVAFVAVTAAAFGVFANRWAWREAAFTARALLPALWVVAAAVFVPAAVAHGLSFNVEVRHPLGHHGWIAWPVAFAALAWILRRVDPDEDGPWTTFLHAGSAVLLAFLGASELNWIAARYTAHATAWSVGAAAFAPALVALVISLRALDERWPIERHAAAYRVNAVALIAIYLAAWSLYANFTHDGRSDPLPYLPVVNALDLAHVFAILSLVAAAMAARRSGLAPAGVLRGAGFASIAGGLAFIWLTGMLLRSVSHWGGVPYTASAMMTSVLAQASLSVFWAMLALAAMVFATRTARRAIWVVGATLMGVVVAKLFLVDLSNVGGIERIVSFIAVGVLMLVIGYFSPVPPRKPEDR